MLERMRQLYQEYPQLGSCFSAPAVRKFLKPIGTAQSEISAPLVRKSRRTPPDLPPAVILRYSWTHLIEFLSIDDPWKRAFYENECLKGNWSVRQLQRQIGSLLYERTGLSTDKAAVIRRAHRQEPSADIADLIRDPYVLEFTGLAERPEYTESDLERALLDHLQHFLLELGTGFCFEARQKRITVGTKHDYIDLVFYHRRLRCHVLLDLKVRPFKHGDAGQMNFYLNWWKKHGMEEATVRPSASSCAATARRPRWNSPPPAWTTSSSSPATSWPCRRRTNCANLSNATGSESRCRPRGAVDRFCESHRRVFPQNVLTGSGETEMNHKQCAKCTNGAFPTSI